MPGNQDDPSETLSLCVRCGRCRSVCPTFELELVETAVARGRVVLAEHLGEGMEPTQGLYRILHTCLLCMACEEVCTNGVPVAEIVQKGREQLRRVTGTPRWKGALSWVLSHPRVMDHLCRAGGVMGLLAPKGREPRGLLLRVPRLVEEGVFLPPISASPFRRTCSGVDGEPRVLLFLGCLIDHCYPEVAKATVGLLQGLGYGCLVPERQYCCGHPHFAMGFREEGERIVRLNTQVFEEAAPDLILTACASCASTLKREYSLDAPVLDLVELLQRHEDRLEVVLPPGVERVGWHQPCHLGRGQGIDGQGLVERLLGSRFVSMENQTRCCGFGGTFSVEFSRLSAAIGADKARWAKESGAQLVLTDCPACMMQLQRSFSSEGVEVAHIASVAKPRFA